MQIKSSEFMTQIKSSLPKLVWISGDEPLQINELREQILNQAKVQKFTEREIAFIDGSDKSWQQLFAITSSNSLFSDKKIIEVKLETLKLGRDAFKQFEKWLQILSEDDLALIISGKTSKETKKLKWVQLLDKSGVICQIWPIEFARLPVWIEARAKQKGLMFEAGAANILALKVEGNLLACNQEIEKLALQNKSLITADFIYKHVGDNSRYDVFQLTDCMLSGDANKTIKVFRALLAEGVALQIIIWAIARDLRDLIIMQHNPSRPHKPVEFVVPFIWQKREPLFKTALHRKVSFKRLLIKLLEIDCASKGFGYNAEQKTEKLLLKIAS